MEGIDLEAERAASRLTGRRPPLELVAAEIVDRQLNSSQCTLRQALERAAGELSLVELARRDPCSACADAPEPLASWLWRGPETEKDVAALAENPKAGPWLLAQLADDDRNGVRERVAGHTAVPERLLLKLSEDEYEQVRVAALKNPRLPLPAMELAAGSDNPPGLFALIQNPALPAALICCIAQGLEERLVSWVETSYQIEADASHAEVRGWLEGIGRYLATHPNAPQELLLELTRHSNPFIRQQLLDREDLGREMLEVLETDSDWMIRRSAQQRLGLLERGGL